MLSTLRVIAVDAEEQDGPLIELGRALQASSYQFVTVTPETHRGVLKRDPRRAHDLRDVFGWSRAFDPDILPARIRALGEAADVFVERENGLVQSSVRFSSLGGHLFVHSAFPTLAPDSVFFGPDTYRYCALLKRWPPPNGRVVDVGCGTGAGGIVAAREAASVVLSDVNPEALRFARVNAALAGVELEVVESDVLSRVPGKIDAVIANPPYMLDHERRLYRDGGGAHGEGLSLRILEESLARLTRGGRLLLYTGAPIIAGRDTLREQMADICQRSNVAFHYEELDPDVFGDQLSDPAYEGVERIAAVALLATVT